MGYIFPFQVCVSKWPGLLSSLIQSGDGTAPAEDRFPPPSPFGTTSTLPPVTALRRRIRIDRVMVEVAVAGKSDKRIGGLMFF